MQPEQTCTFDFFGSPTSTQLQLALDSTGTPLYDHLSTAATVPSINPMQMVLVNQDSHALSAVDLEFITTPMSFQDDSPIPTGFTIPRTHSQQAVPHHCKMSQIPQKSSCSP